jgi:hypothetical protein
MEHPGAIPGVILRNTCRGLRELAAAGPLDADRLAAQWPQETVTQRTRTAGWRKGRSSEFKSNRVDDGAARRVAGGPLMERTKEPDELVRFWNKPLEQRRFPLETGGSLSG